MCALFSWLGQLLIELIKIIPTVLIALIAAGIAYRQYLISRSKLNLDLFERRLRIFTLTWEMLSNPRPEAVINPHIELSNAKPEARFLFGQETEDYIINWLVKRSNLASIHMQIHTNGGVVPAHLIMELSVLESQFAYEALAGVRDHFAPYMDFSQAHGKEKDMKQFLNDLFSLSL